MKYFPQEINNTEQLKGIYRTLSKLHHPDRGGEVKAFVEMKAEYEHLNRCLEYGITPELNDDLIDELYEFMQVHEYQTAWVYYKFRELANEPTKGNFDYLAKVLGYKAGWAYYKWKEYNGEE